MKLGRLLLCAAVGLFTRAGCQGLDRRRLPVRDPFMRLQGGFFIRVSPGGCPAIRRLGADHVRPSNAASPGQPGRPRAKRPPRGLPPAYCYDAPLTAGRQPVCFFFNDTPTTEIYTLSLHDALPISGIGAT